MISLDNGVIRGCSSDRLKSHVVKVVYNSDKTPDTRMGTPTKYIYLNSLVNVPVQNCCYTSRLDKVLTNKQKKKSNTKKESNHSLEPPKKELQLNRKV